MESNRSGGEDDRTEGRKCGAYHGWKWRSYQSESKEDWSDSG